MKFKSLAALLLVLVLAVPGSVQARPAGAAGSLPSLNALPVVAVHISELTRALANMPAAGTDTPQPPGTPGTSGTQWFYTSWDYFVIYESLIEALRSDGTPYVTVSDAEISQGGLLLADGSPKYPIVFSLAAEAASDAEIAPLGDYVKSGGFLFVGSSAFTRYPDGSSRKDFALADEMGLHMVHPELQNWYLNRKFTKETNHRLVSHIPSGTLNWFMPLSAGEVPWGTSYYGHPLHNSHFDFQVRAAGAAVIASGSQAPLLAVKEFGLGKFIYHGDLQPLIGFGGSDSGMYAYGIYRNAIEWAFESAGLPIIKLSPWQYPYDSAFILRHDLEDSAGQLIESSAKAEFEAGAKGDYYFTTGALREKLKNDPSIIASLRRAVSKYGATIGPHNGGLRNPNNAKLTSASLDYWHWGPDEAMNGTQAGYDYALASVRMAYADIDRWLAGVDNGRPGCGLLNDCPHIWVSPYFNSTREESNQILRQMNAVTMGEQKLGPFPHFTLSTRTEGLLYPQLTLPVSDWYIGGSVAQSIESGHSISSIHQLVDFYYDLGALVALYGHASSASGLTNEYMKYSLAKPRMWAANSVMIYDWWMLRSAVILTPAVRKTGAQLAARALMRGAADADTAVEMVLPKWNPDMAAGLQVLVNGEPVGLDRYRITNYGLKIKAGLSAQVVEVFLDLR